MGIILDIIGTIACLVLLHKMAKPYFYEAKDDRLSDWEANRKKQNRRK